MERRSKPKRSVSERSRPAAPGGRGSLDHAGLLEQELDWLAAVLAARLHWHFKTGDDVTPEPPSLRRKSGAYAELVAKANLDSRERLVLILALAPHLRPQLLDPLFVQNTGLGRAFSEFGGWRGEQHVGFLPTGETAAFVAGGSDLRARIAVQSMFRPDHSFRKEDLLHLEGVGRFEPELAGILRIASDWVEMLTTGSRPKPDYSPDFPAKRMHTQLTWDDLVLPVDAAAELGHITGWMRHEEKIRDDWGLGRRFTAGYRCLFYGPPGTGKTLTAALLGQELGLDIYRVDLSQMVSKYIGETEKNLARVFDRAEHRDWLLFFDEADALFGKRTQANTSLDRYGNQEIAYLLQRVEDFPGLVILATNLKSNIDEAFARRFHSLIHFPMPAPEERLILWQGALGDRARLAADVRLDELAERVDLAGGSIINVVRHAAIAALNDRRDAIAHADLLAGVAKEMRKYGRTL